MDNTLELWSSSFPLDLDSDGKTQLRPPCSSKKTTHQDTYIHTYMYASKSNASTFGRVTTIKIAVNLPLGIQSHGDRGIPGRPGHSWRRPSEQTAAGRLCTRHHNPTWGQEPYEIGTAGLGATMDGCICFSLA